MGYRILFLLLVLIAIFAIAGCDFSSFKAEDQEIETSNKAAFDFQLQDLDRNTIRLSDYQNQKVVILVFSATWCPPCVKELPEVQEYYQSADKEQVEVIWIYHNEKESVIKKFREEHSLGFPIANDINSKVYDQYRVSSIPTTVFIDKQGGMAEIKIGALTAYELENKNKKMLE